MEPKTELQWNAIYTARRKELETFQRALDIQWLNSRMEDGRMGRCLALIKREAEMEKDYKERTDHAAIVNARAEKETALGIEIAKVRREETCQLLRRHYLRERDPSLRQLVKKLEAGYVCRDLQMQIQNNEYKRLQEKAEEKQCNAYLLNSLYNNMEALELEEREKMERTSQYRKELQQQLVNRERQRQCTYEDTLIEKKMLEDIMRTLADEDQRELAQKQATVSRMRREMETFRRARDAWKEKQKLMVVREERDVERQKAAVADRSAAIVAERERKRLAKEEMNEKVVAKILADEAALQERENIIKLLQEHEYLEKNVNDDIAEKQKGERVKRETMEALTAQIKNKERRMRDQKEKDEKFRKETEDKIAADLQKDREKEMRKRQKGKQYSDELLRQIEENAARRERDKKMEDARAQYVKDCDKAWQAEVSRERATIVNSHVPQVLGYLTAGLLAPAGLGGEGGGPGAPGGEVGRGGKREERFPKCNRQCMVLREY